MLSVEFTTERREVTDYAVALLLAVEDGTETVRLYDGAQGENEMHRYTRKEGKQPASSFHGGTRGGEGMRAAISEVEDGYHEMIEGWQRQ